MNKALSLLKKRKSVTERSEQYADRIAKSLELSLINPIKENIEKIDDRIFDLENFSLETDLNAGLQQLTKEKAEERFKQIIELHYEKDLLTAQLNSYQNAYDKYFVESKKEKEK